MYTLLSYLHEVSVVVVVETMMDSGSALDEVIIDDVGTCTDVLLGTIK